MPKFKEILVKSKKVKGLSVSLNWDCAEGLNGDYDKTDPDDVPLLRFDVLVNGEQAENGSYCTQLSVNDPRPLLEKAAGIILKEAEATLNKSGFKKSMAQLSWMQIANGNLIYHEDLA